MSACFKLLTMVDLYVLLLLHQDAGSDSTELVTRVKELETVCEEQAAKIEQLNHLVIISITLQIFVCPQHFTFFIHY